MNVDLGSAVSLLSGGGIIGALLAFIGKGQIATNKAYDAIVMRQEDAIGKISERVDKCEEKHKLCEQDNLKLARNQVDLQRQIDHLMSGPIATYKQGID